MFDREQEKDRAGQERMFSWHRIKTILIGSVAALVLGFLILSFYTYFQYGSSPVDGLLGRGQKESPAKGKLAFAKGTNEYIGVIKGEGQSPRRGAVYYIEQPGNVIIELSKESVEVRDPARK